MSTASYNLSEGNVLLAVSGSKSLINGESEAADFFDSQPLPPSILRGDSHPVVADDDLITAAQHGDQQAFVELCERYSSIAKRKILSIVRNQEDAEDALQDTLLRAYTHLASFRRSCKFSTWLTSIGVNSALIIMRKRRVRREGYASAVGPDMGVLEVQEPIDRSPGPEEIYLKQQAILVVKQEVEKLPPRLRAVVKHYYGSECSMECSAKALDISLSAAKSRLMRGRVRLRSSLAGDVISKSRN